MLPRPVGYDVSVPVAAVADPRLVRTVMSRHAGMARDAQGLETAAEQLSAAAVVAPLDTPARAEQAAAYVSARAVLAAATARRESIGCHHRTDAPDATDQPVPGVVRVALDHAGAVGSTVTTRWTDRRTG
ncbi:hypothetical protein GCM10029964_093310 [Kibdelosporangium lantanae]